MTERHHLIERIQSLSKQESMRQPTAAEWLREQDEKARNDAVLAEAKAAASTDPSAPEPGACDAERDGRTEA